MIKNISKRLAKNTLSTRGQLKDRENGFTLVELLITVVIIAILTAIAVPAYISVVTNAQDSAAKQTISSVIAAEDLYYSGAGEGRTAVPAGTFATLASMDTAALIKIDAKTRPSLGVALSSPNPTTVYVSVKSENGKIWVASTNARQPVEAASAAAATTALGNAAAGTAWTSASTTAVD